MASAGASVPGPIPPLQRSCARRRPLASAPLSLRSAAKLNFPDEVPREPDGELAARLDGTFRGVDSHLDAAAAASCAVMDAATAQPAAAAMHSQVGPSSARQREDGGGDGDGDVPAWAASEERDVMFGKPDAGAGPSGRGGTSACRDGEEGGGSGNRESEACGGDTGSADKEGGGEGSRGGQGGSGGRAADKSAKSARAAAAAATAAAKTRKRASSSQPAPGEQPHGVGGSSRRTRGSLALLARMAEAASPS
eukprot:365811-Chlamydomonas_euryale.AAC.4